jgi:hypothetical protein
LLPWPKTHLRRGTCYFIKDRGKGAKTVRLLLARLISSSSTSLDKITQVAEHKLDR